jgi:hypothetical protein
MSAAIKTKDPLFENAMMRFHEFPRSFKCMTSKIAVVWEYHSSGIHKKDEIATLSGIKLFLTLWSV